MKNRLARLSFTLLALLAARPEPVAALGARSFKSGPIQISADGSQVWLVNPDHDSVSRLDTASESVRVFALPAPGAGQRHSPRGLSVKEDGSEVWVACHDSDRIFVLDAQGALLGRIDLPYGSGPYSVALSRDQRLALVTLHRAEKLAVIDVASRSLTSLLGPVYRSPLGIAWMEDNVNAWVTHIFADGEHPFISRVNFAGPVPKLVTQIRVGATQPQASQAQTAPYPAEGGYLTHRGHVAQIPSRSGRQQLWVPTQYNNIHDDSWGPDSSIQSTLRHVDLATRTLPNTNNDKVIFTAAHVHDPATLAYAGRGWNLRVSGPIDIGFSADAQQAYILHEVSNDLLVFDSLTPAVSGSAAPPVEVDVGDRPIGLAVSPQTSLGYVLNRVSRDVSIVDLTPGAPRELRRIPATPGIPEPVPASVLRGERLFHTSADPRISVNAKVGCASCHLNAEHDGRIWSLGNLPSDHGDRSVQTLLGLKRAFGGIDPTTGFGQLHVSGDRDEVQDFEHTIRGEFMRGSGLAANPCPDVNPPDPACTNATRSPDLDALAAYLLSLEPLQKSPFRTATGALSEAARRGATFFLGANRAAKAADSGCAGCHLAPLAPGDVAVYADRKFHDIGRRNPPCCPNEEELNGPTRSAWPWYVNTQGLVGVWATPPWEGGAAFGVSSMIELLKSQVAGAKGPTPHGTPDGLTRRQLADLAEYVLSLDGRTSHVDALARDTDPPRITRVSPTSLQRVEVWFSETVDPASAADPASYRIVDPAGRDVPIAGAVHDAQNGDRVTLLAQLDACADQSYTLVPVGRILDAADRASNGVANALDGADPANQHAFVVGRTLTITLGASGYENLTIPVHDAAMVGPGLSTWSHDSVWLSPGNVGFVRFDWGQAFAQATGVTSPAEIQDASFSLQGEYGDVQTIELRRTLQAWSDPATGGDWNQAASGAPTWRDHAHPGAAWNAAGAKALGGTGGQLGDYNGPFDRAQSIDLTLLPQAVNERVVFSGPAILDAFRFWFLHRSRQPRVDHGYALELKNGRQELKYQRVEHELQGDGPVLTITYELPAAPPAPGEVSNLVSGKQLLAAKLLPLNGEIFLSFEERGAEASAYNVYEGAIGSYYSHAGAACGIQPALRGARRETRHTPAAGSRYLIVTASNRCAEGPSDPQHPGALLDCLP